MIFLGQPDRFSEFSQNTKKKQVRKKFLDTLCKFLTQKIDWKWMF